MKVEDIISPYGLSSSRLSLLLGNYEPLRQISEAQLMQLIQIARLGLPKSAAQSFLKQSGLSQKELADILNITPRTYQLYNNDSLLGKDASERLIHLAVLYLKAKDVFKEQERIKNWLHQSLISLGGQRPIDLLDTKFGFDVVADELGRIAYGVYS